MPSGKKIKAGEAYVTLSTRDRLARGFTAATRRVRAFGSEVTKVGKGLVGIGLAIAAPIALAVREFTKVGDTLDKASQRTGLTTNALSELGFAAEQTGSDLATVEKSTRKMQGSITDLGRGLSTQVDTFARLGLVYADLAGLSPEDQFTLIADRLSLLQNETLKAATATQLFGRSGAQLLPLFNQGAEGIAKLRAQARGLGLSIDPQDAKDAAELADQVNILSRVLRVTLFSAGKSVAPLILDLVKRIQTGAVAFRDFVNENGRLVIGLAKLGGVLLGLGGGLVVFGTLAVSLAGIATVLSPLGAALLLTVPAVLSLVAAFNGGTIAGVDFGKALLQLASDLGIVKSAVIELENAEKAVARAAKQVESAERAVSDASGPRERLRATEALTDALERQIKLRKALKAAEVKTDTSDDSLVDARENLEKKERIAIRSNFRNTSGLKEAQDSLAAAEKEFLSRPDAVADALTRKLEDAVKQGDELRASIADYAIDDDGSVSALTARLERLNVEAAEVEARLAEVSEAGGAGLDSEGVLTLQDRLARLRVEAKVASAELTALNQGAAEGVNLRVAGTGPSIGDTLRQLVTDAYDRVKELTKEKLDLDFEIRLFGADADEAAVIQIEKRIRDLKERARELGTLTPELEQRIEAGARRSLADAFEVDFESQSVALGRQGVFDTRGLQGLAGGTIDYTKETASNTKKTVEAIDELIANGTLKWGA